MPRLIRMERIEKEATCKCSAVVGYFDSETEVQYIGMEESKTIICPNCDSIMTVSW